MYGSAVVTVATRSIASVPGSDSRGGVQGVEVVGRPERSGHCAGRADHAGEPTGVDAADAGDAVGLQHRVQVTLGAAVGVTAGQVADHDAAAEQPPRLEVDRVDPVVADVRVGERDDLPGIARVGEHLLIAAQRRVEDEFTGGDRHVGAEQLALEDRTIGEDQDARTHVHALHCMIIHRIATPSMTVGTPPRIV